MRTAQSNGLRHQALPPDSSYLVAFPSAYSASNFGINFNIDAAATMTTTTYVAPGPPVWPGSGTAAYLDDAEDGRRGDERREWRHDRVHGREVWTVRRDDVHRCVR